MDTLYIQPFTHVASVTIPGTAHGFRPLRLEDIACLPSGPIPAPLTPVAIAIDPTSQDVTLTFVGPETGYVYLRRPVQLQRPALRSYAAPDTAD